MAKRSTSAERKPGARTSAAFATPARTEVTAKNRRAGTRSARFRNAASAVPATNPICTAVVSQPDCEASRFHSSRSSGETALAENHTDIPSTSASDRIARIRQRL